MKQLVLLLTILLLFNQLNAQETTGDSLLVATQKYSTTYVYADASISFGGTAGLNYEKLFETKNGNTFSVIASGGYELFIYIYGPYAGLKTAYCHRKEAHSIELGLGAMVISEWGFFKGPLLLPDVNVGYKYQKPNKHWVLKTGVGFPKVFYFGCGYAF